MRYFLGFLASIGLIILVIILVMRGFSNDAPKQEQAPLSDYANTNTLVRMTVDGPIVADQEHFAYRVSVERNEVTLETLQGFEYKEIETKTYDNNQESFTNFLRALDLAGYTKGSETPESRDERGVCPTGKRYIFEIINGTSEIQRYWATSCGSNQGTFAGDEAEVKRLFDRQIPKKEFSAVNRLRL